MYNFCKEIWSELEKKPRPKYLRNVHLIHITDLRNIIKQEEKVKEILENIYEGDLYVFQDVINQDEIKGIKEDIFEFGNIPTKTNKTSPGCPNYHQITHNLMDPKDGYSTINHSYYIFKWNDEQQEIFKEIEEFWNIVKFLSGINNENSENGRYENDKYIDRAHFIHYPMNHGIISQHMDFPIYQKLNSVVSLSKKGRDFINGGYYLFNDKGEKQYLEQYINIGDCICWFPTMYHGADAPYMEEKKEILDWNTMDGRWLLILNTIESHGSKDRIVTKSVVNVLE